MISLLIPTMNRSEFVIRLLKYYENLSFKHYILIGDSSNVGEFEKTKQAVKLLKGRLNVEHYHYPNLNNYAATHQLIQKVSTPYSAFMPDDDFLVPGSMERFVDFLDHHPDYSCAWGKSIIFNLENSGAYGKLASLGRSNAATGYSIEEDSAGKRLFSHINRYTSVFIGACRTPMFEKALLNALELNKLAGSKDANSFNWGVANAFGELVTSVSLVVQGKVKTIDCLHWIRQGHDQRYEFPTTFDQITSRNWLPCYEVIARQIIDDIVEKDNMSLIEAENSWKKCFWMYLSRGIDTEYQGYDASIVNVRSRIKGKLVDMPRLYNSLRKLLNDWRRIRAKIITSKNVSLQGILNPSCPDHSDFMPVYNLVTTIQESDTVSNL